MSQTLQDYVAQESGYAVKSRIGILGQCVSIPALFFENNGLPSLIGTSAYKIWQTYRSPAYQVIPYGPGMQGQPGDAVFFGPDNASLGTGDAGHIDLFVSGDIHRQWVGFDQDWNTGDGNLLAKQVVHSNNGVLGVMRPIGVQLMERTVTRDDVNRLLPSLFPGQPIDDASYGFVGQAFHDFIYNVVSNPAYVANVNKLLTGALPAPTSGTPPTVVVNGVTYAPRAS